jgi:hypothetical protein
VSSSIPDPIPDDATPEQLRHYVNYWRLEAQGYAVRWNLAMQYGDNLKAENERLSQAYKQALTLLRTYVREDEDKK